MLRISFDFDFSASMKTSIIIFVLLATFFISMGIAFSKMNPDKDEVPTKGLKFLAVVLVDTINKFVDNQLPTVNKKLYAPYLLSIASFLTLANIASCFGLNPPFANLGIALVLSVLAFIIFQYTGLRYQGIKERIKGFMGPMKAVSFLVFPISIIGEITTPLSMGMRMFGNIFSGVVIAGIVLSISQGLNIYLGSLIATVAVTAILHPIFDIFFGILRMYVYFMLTTMFIKQNL